MSFPADRRGYFLISLLIVALDQASKIIIHAVLPARGPVEVIPGFFNLIYARNRGGLFGYFSELSDPWRTLLLLLLPLLAIVLVALFLSRGRDLDRPSLYGLALILGGAVGNFIDRVFRGEVVDFLDLYVSADRLADWLVRNLGTAHWHTFNFADSAIVTGALLLAFGIARPQRPSHAPADPSESR
jgi:signal peptidase II